MCLEKNIRRAEKDGPKYNTGEEENSECELFIMHRLKRSRNDYFHC